MEKSIVSRTAFFDCIVFNNRFTARKLSAEQIGAEDFAAWKDGIAALHRKAYTVYECHENHTDDTAAVSALFAEVKSILAAIGDLSFVDRDGNEHLAPVVIDDNFVNGLMAVVANYAGRIGKKKAAQVELLESKIRNNRTLLDKYAKLNGVNPDSIANLEAEIEEFKDELDTLKDTPDMIVNKPVIGNVETFRKNFENHLARVITEQKAQTWEEYEAAKAARKAAARAKSKEARKAKRQAEAQAQATNA